MRYITCKIGWPTCSIRAGSHWLWNIEGNAYITWPSILSLVSVHLTDHRMKHNERHPMSKRRSQRLIEAKAFKEGQGWDSQTVPTILTFPIETLLMVVSFLDKPWRLSLALTCKFFANLTLELSSKPFITFRERVEVLSTLQKDIPNTYFCYCCARLHPLNPDLD